MDRAEHPSAAETDSKRLLVIDDSTETAQLICAFAKELGCEARAACGWPEIRASLEDFRPQAIVLDLKMPDADGIEVLNYLSEHGTRAGVILISGSEPKVLDVAYRLGNSLSIPMLGTLSKPISLPSLEEILRRALKIRTRISEAELEAAIHSGQIVPYYQSKVAVSQPSQAVGAEVLARWHHPAYGTLAPMEFIGLAEKAGLITEFTFVLLGITLKEMARVPEAFPLSVNLSPSSLDDRTLPDQIEEIVRRAGVEPDMITFEVTESAAARDYSEAMASLTRLRLKGFGLSMDDYGTGYSSLVQLVRLPFREIKLDRSFVNEIGSNRESEVIVRSTISMAHSMNLTVCAEGVETEEMHQFLRSAECDTMQGFLISQPIPGHEFMRLAAAFH